MKVHLIRKETIEYFAKKNAQSRVSFTEWLTKTRYADWESRRTYKILSRVQIYWEIVQTELFLTSAEINTG